MRNTGSKDASTSPARPTFCAASWVPVRESISMLVNTKPWLTLNSPRRDAMLWPQLRPQSIRRALKRRPCRSVYSASVPSTPTAATSRAASACSKSDAAFGWASQLSASFSKASAMASLRDCASRPACSCNITPANSAKPSSAARPARAMFFAVLE